MPHRTCGAKSTLFTLFGNQSQPGDNRDVGVQTLDGQWSR